VSSSSIQCGVSRASLSPSSRHSCASRMSQAASAGSGVAHVYGGTSSRASNMSTHSVVTPCLSHSDFHVSDLGPLVGPIDCSPWTSDGEACSVVDGLCRTVNYVTNETGCHVAQCAWRFDVAAGASRWDHLPPAQALSTLYEHQGSGLSWSTCSLGATCTAGPGTGDSTDSRVSVQAACSAGSDLHPHPVCG
jgi:hypothetical protein